MSARNASSGGEARTFVGGWLKPEPLGLVDDEHLQNVGQDFSRRAGRPRPRPGPNTLTGLFGQPECLGHLARTHSVGSWDPQISRTGWAIAALVRLVCQTNAVSGSSHSRRR